MPYTPEPHFDKLDLAPRPLSRLTYKIMSINLITLAVLAMSFSYISQTRQNLIRNEVDNFESEARLYASIFGKSIDTASDPADQVTLSTLLRELNFHSEQQAIIFSTAGDILASTGNIPLRKAYSETHNVTLGFVERSIAAAEDLLSVNFNLPPLPMDQNLSKLRTPKVQQTIDGLNIAAWSAPDGGLILSASVLLVKDHKPFGTLQLVRRDLQIEKTFSDTRMDVFRFSVISLILTISFSLYLAGLIGHPLRNLATIAENLRRNKGRGVEFPDLSARHDEIGELSQAMREMVEELRKRLNAIESFAADVAHELKNPLTSMKSAVETLPKVKNDADRDRLTAIVHHDLHRMDRLISDISQASRLDAELSRDVLLPLDLRTILDPLIDTKKAVAERGMGTGHLLIDKIGFETPVIVLGHAGRLAQVFENLISNALSFSPLDKKIIISIEANADRAKITVDDEGPGIPESRLEKVFDRFYSERPVTENFGMHSGLGLSIARQIVSSHGGTIHAENRKDENGGVIGARFVVRLKVPNYA